ncbi:MAG TPA: hypothetical protein P5186_01305 [Candidatus Paceibacterota bacterium]|nr:hypothetical protein [Candidatus Paceibacterota bacterium]HRZ99567.1 hypothetical protein [Candidatus Paceibacterota bacterium]
MGAFFLWTFYAPDYVKGIGFTLLGAGLLWWGGVGVEVAPMPPRAWLWLTPAVLLPAVVPGPAWVGPLALLAGAVSLRAKTNARNATLAVILLSFGTFFSVFALLNPGLIWLYSRLRSLGMMAGIFADALMALGIPSAHEAHSIFVQGPWKPEEFTVTLEKTGLYFLAPLFLAIACHAVLCWRRKVLGRLTGYALVIGVYAFLRFLAACMVYPLVPTLGWFWNPWTTFASFLPMVFWLARAPVFETALDLRALATVPEGVTRRRMAWTALGVGLALTTGVVCSFFEDPGKVRDGVVLIDEKHSQWERTTRPYDTQWYGEESGYNYYCLFEFLSHYFPIERNFEPLTSERLRHCRILILKTPTSSYAPEEILAIEEFVKNGGGLWLIGDHTNVFGTSSYLNPVAERFGMHFNYDGTYDLSTHGLSLYRAPRLLPHPVVQGLPGFLFATSCTLDLPWTGRAIIQGYDLRRVRLDYGTKHFFNSRVDDANVDFGYFTQLGAVKWGRGRVLAFTDSTVFSNFYVFLSGKRELLLGCMEWLNRENRWTMGLFVFGALSLGLSGLAIWRGTYRGRRCYPMILGVGLVSLGIGLPMVQVLNQRAYPGLIPQRSYVRVCFEREYSDYDLPIDRLNIQPDRDYHTFFVWAQRVGHVPQVVSTLQEALKAGDYVVLIRPRMRLTASDEAAVRRYVERGGGLILLDSMHNVQSGGQKLLSMFNAGFDSGQPTLTIPRNQAGEPIAGYRLTRFLRGGETIVGDDRQRGIVSRISFGRGVVLAASDAELFSSQAMGTVNQLPDERQKRLYALVYWMFRQAEDQSKEKAETRPDSLR